MNIVAIEFNIEATEETIAAVNAATTQDEVLLHINQSLKKVSSSLNFYFQIAKFKPSFAVEKLGVREELVMMLQIAMI